MCDCLNAARYAYVRIIGNNSKDSVIGVIKGQRNCRATTIYFCADYHSRNIVLGIGSDRDNIPGNVKLVFIRNSRTMLLDSIDEDRHGSSDFFLVRALNISFDSDKRPNLTVSYYVFTLLTSCEYLWIFAIGMDCYYNTGGISVNCVNMDYASCDYYAINIIQFVSPFSFYYLC